MKKEIIFTNVEGVSEDYCPKPSSAFLPNWYKQTDSYLGEKKDIRFPSFTSNGTIKKCVPVFDALTIGYIIPTYCDLIIKKDNDGNILYLPSGSPNAISFHAIEQAPHHPAMNKYMYPKWTNPWAIKTPKGYGSLFMSPVHKGNKYFTVLEGYVDTDFYNAPVNLPFVLNDVSFEGLIPAGTPMVQVVPIKKDSWVSIIGDDQHMSDVNNVAKKLNSRFFDRYKNMFWERKDYR